jgi:hypothetical protein
MTAVRDRSNPTATPEPQVITNPSRPMAPGTALPPGLVTRPAHERPVIERDHASVVGSSA